MSKLKPCCPYPHIVMAETISGWWTIYCRSCRESLEPPGYGRTKGAAIAAWNRRATAKKEKP